MQQSPSTAIAILALVGAGTTAAGCGGSIGTDPGSSANTSTVAKDTPAQGSGGAGGSTGGTSGSGGAATTAPRTSDTITIVPLYTKPIDPAWGQLVAAKRAHPSVPVYAVINPDNGPGSAPQQDYMGGMQALADAGIKVVGYVKTGYASRDKGEARADMERWHSWYPMVSGIFFDEQSNVDGHDGYYRELVAFANNLGMSFTVGNPGCDTRPSFVGAADVTLIYESFGLPDVGALGGWHKQFPREKFGVIPHSAALDVSWVRQARTAVGAIYVTDDSMPNPWDSVPSYLPQLLGALE